MSDYLDPLSSIRVIIDRRIKHGSLVPDRKDPSTTYRCSPSTYKLLKGKLNEPAPSDAFLMTYLRSEMYNQRRLDINSIAMS